MRFLPPVSIGLATTMLTGAAHAQMKLPELKKQPTAQAVLDEHFAALNACDWDRLDDAQVNGPNGTITKGACGDRRCSPDSARTPRTAD